MWILDALFDGAEPTWRSVASIINQYVFSSTRWVWVLIFERDVCRNQFIAWASDFYGHNDMDMVRLPPLPLSGLIQGVFLLQLEMYVLLSDFNRRLA